jgi:hypothetical protein
MPTSLPTTAKSINPPLTAPASDFKPERDLDLPRRNRATVQASPSSVTYRASQFLAAETPRSGQQGALGRDLLDLMDALNFCRGRHSHAIILRAAVPGRRGKTP